VGSGRFKVVFKGFDEKQGIDVAWSKIEADPNKLSHEQMKKIVDEISYGLGLDHPHVIKVRAGAGSGGEAGRGVGRQLLLQQQPWQHGCRRKAASGMLTWTHSEAATAWERLQAG